MIEAYPLCWPVGRKRTESHRREQARFKMSFARGRDEIVRQIELLTGSYPWMKRDAALIISTNVPLRRDGLPYAQQRQPENPGVAVYFTYKKNQMCFACDRWQKVEDGRRKNLGYFLDKESATEAYEAAKLRLHAFQPTVRGK